MKNIAENKCKYREWKSYLLSELKETLTGWGEPAYRANQIFLALHKELVSDFSEITTLPLGLRQRLHEIAPATCAVMRELQHSAADGTEKYLFSMRDGALVESVLMRYEYGDSVCVSSQVGCRMGCRFCASARSGLERSLEPGEMLDQIYQIQKMTGRRVTHAVVMGTGEPLDNYDALVRFLRILCDPAGLGISQRCVTVSTCGLPDRIRELAEEHFQITLAISLHAPNDALRRTIMPVANRYSIQEILSACREYAAQTGRRISFEYSLIEGVNDGEEQARELGTLLRDIPCHINLISINPVKGAGYHEPDPRHVLHFKNILEKYKNHVTIRRKLGDDIDAACGQLRGRYLDADQCDGERERGADFCPDKESKSTRAAF